MTGIKVLPRLKFECTKVILSKIVIFFGGLRADLMDQLHRFLKMYFCFSDSVMLESLNIKINRPRGKIIKVVLIVFL